MVGKFCNWLADSVGTDTAVVLVITLSILEIVSGSLAKFDPYPFQFLSMMCNLVGLWMFFIIARSQNQLHDKHDDLHDKISKE